MEEVFAADKKGDLIVARHYTDDNNYFTPGDTMVIRGLNPCTNLTFRLKIGWEERTLYEWEGTV